MLGRFHTKDGHMATDAGSSGPLTATAAATAMMRLVGQIDMWNAGERQRNLVVLCSGPDGQCGDFCGELSRQSVALLSATPALI